ncbi:MAG: hypothetical protein L6R19_26815 [Alphaproteobacteria bacterium]|nr:hypothetical protein [Alphaproteobacteria bacterium]
MGKIGDALRRGLSHSFFVRRGGHLEYVKAGDVFRQRGAARVGETAVVTGIGLDGQQIPHVRYRLTFKRGRGLEFDGGARTMALKPFLKMYGERVPPSAAPSADLAKAAE